MQSVKRDYCRNAMTFYCNLIGNPKSFINMDEAAVYLNCAPNRTVHLKGEKTVSATIKRSSSMRFTLSLPIAMDGSKLPLFVIFKCPQVEVWKDLCLLYYRPVLLGLCSQKHRWITGR